MAHIRNCTLCGSEYDYCPRCDKTKPTFYIKYCSDNCNNISLILNKFAFNHLTKEEAADALKKCDLSKLDKYSVKKQAYINDILSVETESEPIVEVEPQIETIEPEIKEPEQKPEYIPSSSNRYKRSNRRK